MVELYYVCFLITLKEHTGNPDWWLFCFQLYSALLLALGRVPKFSGRTFSLFIWPLLRRRPFARSLFYSLCY